MMLSTSDLPSEHDIEVSELNTMLSKMERTSKRHHTTSSNRIEIEDLRVKIQYHTDVSIPELHREVCNLIPVVDHHRRVFLERSLELLDEMVPDTVVARKNDMSSKKSILTELESLRGGRLAEYAQRSVPFLQRYGVIGPAPKTIWNTQAVDSTDDDVIRSSIIDGYIDLIRRYISVDMTRTPRTLVACEICGGPLEKMKHLDNVILVCTREECGMLKYVPSERHGGSKSAGKRSSKVRFLEALTRFKCEQDTKFPANVEERLDIYLYNNGLPSCREIRDSPHCSLGRREMYEALVACKLTQYCKDINLLRNVYWGWIPPDISSIEQGMIDDFDTLHPIIERYMKEKIINAEFLLYAHLLIQGYKCDISEFRVAKGDLIIKSYRLVFAIACAETGIAIPPEFKMYH